MRTSVTVIEAASSHDLTVLDTLKQELKISPRDQSNNAALLRSIRAATGAINSACGRPFGLETVRQRFFLDHRECVDVLVLNRTPVIGDVTSVTEGDDTLLDAENFDLVDASQGLLARTGRLWSASEITVVYRGGYQLLGDLPDEIEHACLRLAADYYQARGRDSAVRSVNIPDVEAVTYAVADAPGRLPPDVRELLRPYLKVI